MGASYKSRSLKGVSYNKSNIKRILIKKLRVRQCSPAPLSSVCEAGFLPPLSFDASPEDSVLCSYSSSSCSCLYPGLPSCLKSQGKEQAVKIKVHLLIKCKHH